MICVNVASMLICINLKNDIHGMLFQSHMTFLKLQKIHTAVTENVVFLQQIVLIAGGGNIQKHKSIGKQPLNVLEKAEIIIYLRVHYQLCCMRLMVLNSSFVSCELPE